MCLALVAGTLSATGTALAASVTVISVLDSSQVTSEGLVLQGWAVNRALPNAVVPIHVYDTSSAGTVGYSNFRADRSRPDVGFALRTNSEHGFSITVPLTAGAHRVCAYGIDERPGGTNIAISCTDVDFGQAAPIGSVDDVGGGRTTFSPSDSIRIRGWALDIDRPDQPLEIHVYDTAARTQATAGSVFRSAVVRPDVPQVVRGAGLRQGFDFDLRLSAVDGRHDVCVFAIGVGSGGNSLLACRSISVSAAAGPAPVIGNIDGFRVRAVGLITVAGWALNTATTTSPAQVRVSGWDGEYTGSPVFPAALSRPDVAAVFPGAGDLHGFEYPFLAYPGKAQNVCLSSGSTTISCRTIDVENAPCTLTSAVISGGYLRIVASMTDTISLGVGARANIWVEVNGAAPRFVTSIDSINSDNLDMDFYDPASFSATAQVTVHIQPRVYLSAPASKLASTWCASAVATH